MDKIRKVVLTCSKWGSHCMETVFSEWMEKGDALLKALGGDITVEVEKGECNLNSSSIKSTGLSLTQNVALPKNLRLAIAAFPKQEDSDSLFSELDSILKSISYDEDDSPQNALDEDDLNAIAIDDEIDLPELRKYTPAQLKEKLGLPGPGQGSWGLAQKLDPAGDYDGHSEEGREYLAKNGEQLDLRWHQWAGVFRMISAAFNGEPILLLDEVGIGKTLQIFTVFAVLRYFRHYFEQHQQFPGDFSELTLVCIFLYVC
jgi:SNF2 family DNA or RNA helicase